MNILVTAGNTLAPIDRVRAITNIFTGRTGTRIALHCLESGHAVTLLTSHPELVPSLSITGGLSTKDLTVRPYRTFEDLQACMQKELTSRKFDALIHCAAVSDYHSAGIFAPAAGTRFDAMSNQWQTTTGEPPGLVDRMAGKVKSTEAELWLRMVRAPKLIDSVRTEWSFRGILVKFKLEVGVEEDALLTIAERSRRASEADLMVANTLEGSQEWALLGPIHERYERVTREELPQRLLEQMEQLHTERTHG